MLTQSKRSGLPLYYQVEESIRKKIEEGVYVKGQMIPPESKLEKEFKVSRITVRRAIENLVYDGLLVKQQGIGTIVTNNYINDEVNTLESFTEKMERQGRTVSSTILGVEMVIPPQAVLTLFSIKENCKVLKLSRIRHVDGAPLALFNTYISPRIGITPDEDFSHSLFDLYTQFGVEVYYSDRTIHAIVADKRIAELLCMNEGGAALQMNYQTFDITGQAIEYAEGIYRGDWYHYQMRIYRKPMPTPASGVLGIPKNISDNN